jgi:cytochrome c biogenesis factor
VFDDLYGPHVLVILVILALDVLALVQVWRDRRRSDAVKILWTVVVIVLPVIGLIGWAVNWLLGRAADRLGRSSAR